MPRKIVPGRFEIFNGLWKRGSIDNTPPDHFSDSQNLCFKDGVQTRDGLVPYLSNADIVRMRLFKPNPPFAGTNVPRIIALNSAGNLIDLLLGTTLTGNILFKDFSLVNFFGRAYISFSDGKTGTDNQYLNVYDGTTFRTAGGIAPVAVPILAYTFDGVSKLEQAEYLFAVCNETTSGYITKPCTPQYIFCSFRNTTPGSVGGNRVDLTNVALGPAGTVARWIIGTRAIFPTLSYNGNPEAYEYFFIDRIADNTTTTYTASYFDTELTDSADYLFNLLELIPAGVGLLDYNGRLVSYGEHDDPSIVRVSTIGEPESFNASSGFFITDPTDSTGVRSATQFRSVLYVFKRERGYLTQDNQGDASTWLVDNFEKSVGAEQYGIADILDAKGSSSDGFVIASLSGIHFFNGVVQEPELSYKIKDLWDRVNKTVFHKIQLVQDPINRRIYCLVPLDDSFDVNYIIYGDYRNGLDPSSIKWDLWKFASNPTSILIYGDFTNDISSIVTRISDLSSIKTLTVNTPGSDVGTAIDSFFETAPVRYGDGLSEFHDVVLRILGPCTIGITLYGMNKTVFYNAPNLVVTDGGREYLSLLNLVNEHGILRISHRNANQSFKISKIYLNGNELWKERAG